MVDEGRRHVADIRRTGVVYVVAQRRDGAIDPAAIAVLQRLEEGSDVVEHGVAVIGLVMPASAGPTLSRASTRCRTCPSTRIVITRPGSRAGSRTGAAAGSSATACACAARGA